MTEARLPPQNLDAERSCLGSQMLDERMIDEVRSVISPSDYYLDVHGTIQKSLQRLRDNGGNVDPVTLAAELDAQGRLQDCGGIPYLIELMESVPHALHAKHYATIVAKCKRRRSAISVGQRLMEAAYDAANDDLEVSQAAINAASELAEHQIGVSRLVTMQDSIYAMLAEFEKGLTPTVNVMIPCIDTLIGGAAPGEMIILAGRPSHGKTMVACQCLDMAASHGWPGLVISEEMTAQLLASRSLSSITDIPSDRWLNETDRLRFDVREHFSEHAQIVIAEKCGTVATAERMIAEAVRTYKVKIVAIDYAQLLKGDGTSEQERIADVSQRMKAAAVKHGVILLLLSQMNRGIETRENAEPGLADLRGSGSLEQDGDVILFPFWPWKLDSSYPDPLEYRVYQRKNRNRGISTTVIKMKINPSRQRIEPAQPEEHETYARDWN